MKIGIFSDVHADYGSLYLALRLFQDHDVESMICAGDIVEKGLEDDKVVATFRSRQIPCVQGNHDENAVHHHRLSQTNELPDEVPLKPDTIEYLDQLPTTFERTYGGVRILVAHAIPSHNAGRVFHDDGPSRLAKRFKKDLARAHCDLLVVGHTHRPFDIRYRAQRIINPGSTCSIKSRDSHTAGILDLESESFEVYHLDTGDKHDVWQADVA